MSRIIKKIVDYPPHTSWFTGKNIAEFAERVIHYVQSLFDQIQEFYKVLEGVKDGKDGKDGADGIMGPTGPQGPVGPQGIPGPVGPTGPKGDKGDKGDTGEKGEQGIPGRDGVDGAPGLKGDKGDKGDQGPRGFQGVKGDKGDKGDRGPQGIQGEQGPAGADGKDGKNGENVFWATYNETTFNEIKEAIEAGKTSCVVLGNTVYSLQHYNFDNGEIAFSSIDNEDCNVGKIYCYSDDSWEVLSSVYQSADCLVNTIDTSTTSDYNYPSTQAVVDYVKNNTPTNAKFTKGTVVHKAIPFHNAKHDYHGNTRLTIVIPMDVYRDETDDEGSLWIDATDIHSNLLIRFDWYGVNVNGGGTKHYANTGWISANNRYDGNLWCNTPNCKIDRVKPVTNVSIHTTKKFIRVCIHLKQPAIVTCSNPNPYTLKLELVKKKAPILSPNFSFASAIKLELVDGNYNYTYPAVVCSKPAPFKVGDIVWTTWFTGWLKNGYLPIMRYPTCSYHQKTSSEDYSWYGKWNNAKRTNTYRLGQTNDVKGDVFFVKNYSMKGLVRNYSNQKFHLGEQTNKIVYLGGYDEVGKMCVQ